MESLVPVKSFPTVFLIKNVHQNRQGKCFANVFPQITVTNAILVTKTNCLQMQNVIVHTSGLSLGSSAICRAPPSPLNNVADSVHSKCRHILSKKIKRHGEPLQLLERTSAKASCFPPLKSNFQSLRKNEVYFLLPSDDKCS